MDLQMDLRFLEFCLEPFDKCRCDGMADVKHSKCFVLRTCGFESHHRHHFNDQSAILQVGFLLFRIYTKNGIC